MGTKNSRLEKRGGRGSQGRRERTLERLHHMVKTIKYDAGYLRKGREGEVLRCKGKVKGK